LIRRYQSARTQAAEAPSTGETPRLPAAIPNAAVPAPAAVSPIQTPSALGFSADTGAADVGAAQPLAATNVTAGQGGMFHSLFLAGQRRDAISPAISELWGAPGKQQPPSPPVTGAEASAPRNAGQGATFDLFRTDGK
jgi:hypothetical protein